MTRYISSTDTAKMIRQAISEKFPEVKFGVRTRKYSGGASVDVSWTDGPTDKEVDEIAGQFRGATFDAMIDLKSYVTSYRNGEEVHFGADYVFCKRNYSDYALITALNEYRAMWGGTDGQFVPAHQSGRFEIGAHVLFDDYQNQERYNAILWRKSYHQQAVTVVATNSDVDTMLQYRDF